MVKSRFLKDSSLKKLELLPDQAPAPANPAVTDPYKQPILQMSSKETNASKSKTIHFSY